MKPYLRAVRAIAAEFVRRAVWPLLLIIGIILVLLFAVALWLSLHNAWWIFLAAPLLLLTLIATGVMIVLRMSLRLVGTEQSKDQIRLVRGYVDQLERLRETIQTPYPLLIARAVLDVIRPRQDGFVATATKDSTTLLHGFHEVVASFNDRQVIEGQASDGTRPEA